MLGCYFTVYESSKAQILEEATPSTSSGTPIPTKAKGRATLLQGTHLNKSHATTNQKSFFVDFKRELLPFLLHLVLNLI